MYKRKTPAKLYLGVTADKYELPLIVTDNVREMSEKTGYSEHTIAQALSRGYKRSDDDRGRGKIAMIRFYRISVEECDD